MREDLDRGFDGADRREVAWAKRRLARTLRALEEAAFDPLVLSAAELAEAEEVDGGLDESPFS